MYLHERADAGRLGISTARDACRNLRFNYCILEGKFHNVSKEIQRKQSQLENARWRLERLRCMNWPVGGRRPVDHAKWCNEITNKIKLLEREINELRKTTC
jgi:hypothetical protein